MSGFGDVLREARQKQDLSIQQVSDAIHITPAYLEALEAERLDEFPADVYARGFLRSYSSYLGLDPTPLLEQFSLLRSPPAAEMPPGRRRRVRVDTEPITPDVSQRRSAPGGKVRPSSLKSLNRDRRRVPALALWIVVAGIVTMVGVAAQRTGILNRIGSHIKRTTATGAAPLKPGHLTVTKAPVVPPHPQPVSAHGLTLTLRSTGYVYVKVTTDMGKDRQFQGEWMPGDHQTYRGHKQINVYADRGNNLTAAFNGKDLGRLATTRRRVWQSFPQGTPPVEHPSTGTGTTTGSGATTTRPPAAKPAPTGHATALQPAPTGGARLRV